MKNVSGPKKWLYNGLLALLVSQNTYSQTEYQYSYDESGNRIQRIIVVPRLANFTDSIFPYYENIDEIKIKLYPNPVDNTLYIERLSTTNVIEELSIELCDLNDKSILKMELKSKLHAISMPSIKSAIYTLYIRSKNVQKQWKIIKL